MWLPVARAQANPVVKLTATTREVRATGVTVKAPNTAEREVARAIREGEVMADTTNRATAAVTVMAARMASGVAHLEAHLEAAAANVVELDNDQYYW